VATPAADPGYDRAALPGPGSAARRRAQSPVPVSGPSCPTAPRRTAADRQTTWTAPHGGQRGTATSRSVRRMKQAPVIAMGSGKSLHRGINVHH